LGQFAAEIDCVWSDMAVPSRVVIEELYEFGMDADRADRGRLTLSTVHSAKGREFQHVFILDGGDWRDKTDPEKRLYYVGMTRAKENLVLCQSVGTPNPFSSSLNGEATIRIKLPAAIERPEVLNWRYIPLGLADVDLGFAGRSLPGHSIHRAIEHLEFGEALELVSDGRGLALRSKRGGVVIGRLARRFSLPPGQVVAVSVDALVRRYKEQSAPEYADLVKSDRWWVVLATITCNAGNNSSAGGKNGYLR
jgi:ATP-dependent DNA helicase RecQ